MQITIESPSKFQLCQRDSHWTNLNLGSSLLTVGSYGCALTCVSMHSAEIGSFVDPGHLAVKTDLFTHDGLILWQNIHKYVPQLQFIWRSYKYDPNRIAGFLEKGLKMTQVQVPIKNRALTHWLKVISIIKTNKGVDYLCYNPWNGQKCLAIATYGSIIGSVHLDKL